MISLLRKVRKQLLSENSFSKPASRTGRYLLYAIGEIILVVVGILIALQINTWNQNKIIRTEEQIYLKGLKNEFKKNL